MHIFHPMLSTPLPQPLSPTKSGGESLGGQDSKTHMEKICATSILCEKLYLSVSLHSHKSIFF